MREYRPSSDAPVSSPSIELGCRRAIRSCRRRRQLEELRHASRDADEAYNLRCAGIPRNRVATTYLLGEYEPPPIPATSQAKGHRRPDLEDQRQQEYSIEAANPRTSTSGWSGKTSSCRRHKILIRAYQPRRMSSSSGAVGPGEQETTRVVVAKKNVQRQHRLRVLRQAGR